MLDAGPGEKRPKKWLFIILGTVCLITGVVGLATPILPGAILIILAANFYAKSSRRIYNWLRENRWLGKYVRNAEEKGGVSWKVKIGAISYIALSAAFNIFILFKNTGPTLKISSLIFALITAGLVIFFVPTAKK